MWVTRAPQTSTAMWVYAPGGCTAASSIAWRNRLLPLAPAVCTTSTPPCQLLQAASPAVSAVTAGRKDTPGQQHQGHWFRQQRHWACTIQMRTTAVSANEGNSSISSRWRQGDDDDTAGGHAGSRTTESAAKVHGHRARAVRGPALEESRVVLTTWWDGGGQRAI